MKKADVSKLVGIIEAEVAEEARPLYADAFALGCYLHLSGQKRAGRKLCNTLFSALGFERRKVYFSEILDSLEGNERTYAEAIRAHSEINDLFERSQST
jgi:hypothetical protein